MSYFWPLELHLHAGSLAAGGISAAHCVVQIRSWGLVGTLVSTLSMRSPVGHRWTIALSAALAALSLHRCRVLLLDDADSSRIITAAGAAVVFGSVYYSCVS